MNKNEIDAVLTGDNVYQYSSQALLIRDRWYMHGNVQGNINYMYTMSWHF